MIEEKNINVGSFNDVDFFYYGDAYAISGASFNRNHDLNGTYELFRKPVIPGKRINIRIINRKGNYIAEFKDIKQHCNFKKVKTVNVQFFDSFTLIKVVI